MNKIFNVLVISGLCLSQIGDAAFLPVCQRTEQVRRNLEKQIKKTCQDIGEIDLLSLNRVAVERGISNFKRDDFSGLKNLEILNIRSNRYTELPEGLFDDLGNLKTLVIIATRLRHYPDDFLNKTPFLENLHVFRNPVRSMSESLFVRLENMKNLKVIDVDDELQEAEKLRLRKIFPENGRVQLFFN